MASSSSIREAMAQFGVNRADAIDILGRLASKPGVEAQDMGRVRAAITASTKGKRNVMGVITCPICGEEDSLAFIREKGQLSGGCATPGCIKKVI